MSNKIILWSLTLATCALVSLAIVLTTGGSGCALKPSVVIAKPACRHIAPYTADVYGDAHGCPVRIAYNDWKDPTSPLGFIGHAWPEAFEEGRWQELAWVGGEPVPVGPAPRSKRQFTVMGFLEWRQELGAKHLVEERN